MKAEEEQKLDALWSVWETWLVYVRTDPDLLAYTRLWIESEQRIVPTK